MDPLSRRGFLTLCSSSVLLTSLPVTWSGRTGKRHASGPGKHPDPRPGIDASRVLTAEQIADHPDAITAFDRVREIPQIVDGIRCHCGCATREGFYSLLSCYEGEGMARMCEVCQGEGRLAHRLHKSGKSLAEIREAIDARFG